MSLPKLEADNNEVHKCKVLTVISVLQGSSISGPRAKSGPRRPNSWPAEQRQNAEEICYIFFKIQFLY